MYRLYAMLVSNKVPDTITRGCAYSLLTQERVLAVPVLEVRTDCERRRHVAVHLGSRAQNESHVRVHAVHQKRLLGVRTAFLTACKSMRESKSAKVQSILRSDTAIPTVSQDIDGVSRILTSVGRTMCKVLATPVKARPPLAVRAPVVALTACRPQADCAAARRSSTPTCSCCH